MRQLKPHLRPQCELHHSSRPEALAGSAETHDLLLGAKEVYEALCAPSQQKIGNFDIASATIPARNISGDFVTTFERDGLWFLALGDLMGKGLSAAMWLTHVLDLLRRACETGQGLPEIMGILNREMYRSRVGVPLTSLFLASLDRRQSKLTYSCGGCPPGFLLAAGQKVTMLERGGPILGALEHASYSSATIDFHLGDTLLVVSDGVIEVHQGSNFDLRPDRVAHHLRFTAGDTATSIVQSLLTRVQTTSRTIIDDLSLLAIKRVA